MTYSYLYNLQGDVIGLVDSAGNLVVEYKYNAWGSITGRAGSLSETLGKLNPFRYRGYVYDEETWMYWLKSRYYYLELSRFISADVVVGKVGSVNGHNLYAYCGNDPINCLDPSGNSSIEYMREMAVLHDVVANKVAEAVHGCTLRTATRTKGAGRHGGYGYPDVIIIGTDIVWEIKPNSPYGLVSGPAQMRRYVNGGRIPGWAVVVNPFSYTLNGKTGTVYVTNGMTPVDRGVVYYTFVEDKEREPAYDVVPAPATAVETERDGVGAGSIIATALLEAALGLTLLSPIPGDEAIVGAALLASVH